MKKQQGSALVITVIILIVALVGALGYITYKNLTSESKGDATNTSQDTNALKTKTFRSQEHGITFNYPETWSVNETVQEGSTPEWYASTVKVLNADGQEVALLGTNGQFGGLCAEDQPLIPVSTTIKEALTLKGVQNASFGYTVIESATNNYGVAFGLVKNDIKLGEDSVRCPSMGVNYKYYVATDNQALGGVMFGLWYAGAQNPGDPNAHKLFSSMEQAKTYAQSDEFKKIENMIKSLSIGA